MNNEAELIKQRECIGLLQVIKYLCTTKIYVHFTYVIGYLGAKCPPLASPKKN